MSVWGETKTVARVPDATDQSVPPGAADPKVRLPVRLMTPAEASRASKDWTIVGGNGGIVEVSSGCLGSDTRSSMEEYWRRRPVIVGADIARFWENLFAGRDVALPRVDAVPIPPGWRCGPWRRSTDTTPVQMPAGGITQRYENFWRICSPPTAPAPQPARRPAGAVLRPPTTQTPRPAPPKPPRPVPQQPTKVRQDQPLPGTRPSTCGRWISSSTTPVPAAPAPGDRIETRTRLSRGQPMPLEWRRCLISAETRPSRNRAIQTEGTSAQIDAADEVMRWLEGQEALATELAMQPPDVRRAILVENPEVLYVWWLLGWIELDEPVRLTFWTLAAELREIGLSLFDFEEAARADLPPAVAHELRAAPLGLAQLVEPGPSSTQVAAGQWDAETGVFLPTEPSVFQRGSYGYTPQAPRLPNENTGCGPWRTDRADPRQDQRIESRGDGAWRECDPSSVTVSGAAATRRKSTTIAGCGCEGTPRIGGPLAIRDGDRGLELEHQPCPPTRVAGALAGGRGTTAPEWTRRKGTDGPGPWISARRMAPPVGAVIEWAMMNRSGGFGTAMPRLPLGADFRLYHWRLAARARDAAATDSNLTAPADAAPADALPDEEDPTCCPHCAIENLGPTARAWCAGIADPAARVGDFWSDLGRGVASADRWLSDNVWENVKGVVPYGEVIDAAHQTRMRALEAAAPDFYPSRGTRSGTRPPTTKKTTPARTSSSTTDAATDRAITAATRLASGVRAGDARTIATVKGIKDRAEAGDPGARRNWRVYVLVARDLHGTA